MDIRINADGDETAMLSLYRWLGQDPDLRRTEITLSSTASAPGRMGGAAETINAVISNAIALSNLVVAVAAWRASRPHPPEVNFERGDLRISIPDASPETISALLNAMGDPGAEADRDETGRPSASGAAE